MGNHTGSCQSDARTKSDELYFAANKDGSAGMSKEALTEAINENHKLARLAQTLCLTLGIDEATSKEITARVAMTLAGVSGDTQKMTQEQFHKFRMEYIEDPKGNQGFMHRCVFAAWDEDCSGALTGDELDKYLGVYFDGTFGVRRADPRLKDLDQAALKKYVYDVLDRDGNEEITFEELEIMLSGRLDLADVAAAASRGGLIHL